MGRLIHKPYETRDSLEFRPRVDPVTFEVIRHRLWQINAEQALTIKNISGSPAVSEAMDFNACIIDAAGKVLYIGPHAIHLVAPLSLLVENVYKIMGHERIVKGIDNVYLTNDPWLGAAHQNDVCVLGPLHWGGEIVAWIASTAHQVDVGGMDQGSMCSQARDVFQEAPRYRFIKVMEDGEVCPETVASYLTNCRIPSLVELDLRAQIAGINVAKERLFELIRKYGLDTVTAVMQDIQDYSDILFKRKLLELPNGRWYAEDYIDHDGHEDKLYATRLTLTKEGDHLTFDYRGTDKQAPGFINSTFSGCFGGTFSSTITYLCHDIPWNQGIMRSIEIFSEEGTLNNASFPAPVSMAAVSGGWTTLNVCMSCLGKMLSCSDKHHDEFMANWHGSWLAWNVFGKNQYGENFGTMMTEGKCGGGGARAFADGHNVAGSLNTPQSNISNVETTESRFPVLYLYRRRAVDSGGPGRFRGGVTVETAVTPHKIDELDLRLATFGSDQSCSVGIGGGYPGGGAYWLLVQNSDIWNKFRRGEMSQNLKDLGGELQPLPPKIRTTLRFNDVFVAQPHGGGGYGDPLEREPMRVQADVEEGLVSREYARIVYGVVVDEKGSLSPEETEIERANMRQRRTNGKLVDAVTPQTAQRGKALGRNMLIKDNAILCRGCGFELGGVGENPKARCVCTDHPLRKANPWVARRWEGNSKRFILKEYVCPQCGLLIAVDQRLKAENAPWNDYLVL